MSERIYWEIDQLRYEEVEIPIGSDCAEITVDSELPMRGDEKLPRRGNRYYPTLITLDFRHRHQILHGDTARDLGQALIRAADLADATDEADTDPCGHWHPCDCSKNETEPAP